MGNFLKELFIDEVKGSLISDVGGYDTNGDGVIDNAAQLGGIDASEYALKTDVPETALDSYKLGGVNADEYALKTYIPNMAMDSDKLGGVAASKYALKTDIRSPIVTDDGNGNITIS